MATAIRTLYRLQHPSYVRGNKNVGFVFELQTTERRNGVHLQYFSIEGDQKMDRDEAKRSAWTAAKAWVAENGFVDVTDSEYTSILVEVHDYLSNAVQDKINGLGPQE